jgi:hypothetical protein
VPVKLPSVAVTVKLSTLICTYGVNGCRIGHIAVLSAAALTYRVP